MSTSNFGTEKGSTTKTYKHECLDCENYKRKVKETEQTVSGRDVLIEMLQQEVKKMEERYKTLIDEYEQLRFKYCTAVQELSSLKEINKKLEKSNTNLTKNHDIATQQLEKLQKELDSCKNQCTEKPSQLISNEGDKEIKADALEKSSIHQNILKEVMNIEVIMQNQNETVKDVLLKVLNEMKGDKSTNETGQISKKTSVYTENIKDRNKEDLLAIIEDLNTQVEVMNALVEKIKTENESIKTQLTEKKSNLAQCLDVLEDNHSNLNSLSGNIEMIIKEKEAYLNETIQLKNIIEDKNKMLDEKDIEISDLKGKLTSGGSQYEACNPTTNIDAQKCLHECEKQLEQLRDEYIQQSNKCSLDKCKELAQAIEGGKDIKELITKISGKSVEKPSEHSQSSKNRPETENKNVATEYQLQNEMLKERIKSLERDLEQIKLENNEYEEENKFYGQKLENLATQLQALEKEKMESDNTDNLNNLKVAELKQQYETLNSQKDSEIEQLKSEINNLQNEITRTQEKDEKQILTLQEKINQLENSHYEKEKEIERCFCDVRNIKKALANTDENNVAQISLLKEQKCKLEMENQQLHEKLTILKDEFEVYQQTYKGCDCTLENYKTEMTNLESANKNLKTNITELEVELCRRDCANEKLQEDIKEMEVEICRRQCAIHHLQQCMDKSNKILAECEKELKEMNIENEKLKKENDFIKNKYASEKDELQEKVDRSTRRSQDLELEKNKLSMNLKDKSSLEDELNQLRKRFNDLTKLSKEKDEQLMVLKNQIEANKREHEKIMKAYREVKETLSSEIKRYKEESEKMNNENDKIKLDLKQDAKCTACLDVRKLHNTIMEKEKLIKELEQQNRELTSEVAQLKAYLNKVISDNKNLRAAIDHLLTTLVEKLRGFTENSENISLKSNELLVKDILNSLIDLEQNVIVSTSNTSVEKCNCMSIIMSTYKLEAKDAKTKHIPSCKLKCGKKVRDVSKYVNARMTNSNGVTNICTDCCDEREKGQDDMPESRSAAATRSLTESYIIEPDKSR